MPHNFQPREWEQAIGIGEEARFGEAVPPALFVPGKSTLKRSAGVRIVERPTGRRAASRWTLAPYHVTGSLELEVAPGREQIIKDLLTMRDRRLPKTFTVMDVLGDQATFQNTGVAANTTSIKCAKGEDLIATCECIGRDRQRLTSALVVPPTDFPAPYVFEEMDIAIYGGSHFDLDDIEVSIGQKLKDDKTGPGTRLLREIPSDGLEVTLKLAHAYEHDELWDAGMAQIEMAVRLVWTRGAATLVVYCPRCVCLEPDVEGNMQPLELTALASLDGSVEPVVFV
jgi:hypothetical protein